MGKAFELDPVGPRCSGGRRGWSWQQSISRQMLGLSDGLQNGGSVWQKDVYSVVPIHGDDQFACAELMQALPPAMSASGVIRDRDANAIPDDPHLRSRRLVTPEPLTRASTVHERHDDRGDKGETAEEDVGKKRFFAPMSRIPNHEAGHRQH